MSIRTIVDDLSSAAERDPDQVAVIADERELSYGELDRLAGGFAAGLAELGVRRGDRVAVLLPNEIDAAVAIEGTWRAGAA
ncbi:MAG: AMP-binding protein, partial [Solirubrobacterales bacterium]